MPMNPKKNVLCFWTSKIDTSTYVLRFVKALRMYSVSVNRAIKCTKFSVSNTI